MTEEMFNLNNNQENKNQNLSKILFYNHSTAIGKY